MKFKTYILITILFLSASLSAQIDRSKQPKPGPIPKIDLKKPNEFELSNGLKVLVVENHKLPRVSYSLNIDNKPIVEGDKSGMSSILGAMLGNGTTSISKDDFTEEIDFYGATLGFSFTGAFASSLTKYSDRILELMADAAINPLLTDEEFQKEKDRQIQGLKIGENSVDNIAGRVRNALSYGTHHPYGEYTTEKSIKNISLDNIRAFYHSFFNPGNAYLVIIGDVNLSEIKAKVETHFGQWQNGIEVETSVPKANPNAQYTQINFVDVPNAVQSNISITNNVNLNLDSPDYHAVILANAILGTGTSSYLFSNLREAHGYTYGAGSSIGTDKYASRFLATASVRNMVTDSAVVEALKEINRIKNEPVTQEALDNAKAIYVGNFVLSVEQPNTIANYALNIKINNLPEDFYATFLEKINAITIEDIQRVAKKYFKTENARIVVVGKGSDVINNLEKTGIPIKYFDKFGNETDKPNYDSSIPEGLSATSVFDKYFEAIGGKSTIQKIQSVHMIANANANGTTLEVEFKRTSQNQSADIISIGGNIIQKTVFNRSKGYIQSQGQKIDIPEAQLENAKLDALPFTELNMTDAVIERVEAENGGNEASVVVKLREGKVAYYDAYTGFKTKEVTTQKIPTGQEITTTISYSDYKEVNGIKFPFKLVQSIGPQNIELTIKEIKLNEGITDADFE